MEMEKVIEIRLTPEEVERIATQKQGTPLLLQIYTDGKEQKLYIQGTLISKRPI